MQIGLGATHQFATDALPSMRYGDDDGVDHAFIKSQVFFVGRRAEACMNKADDLVAVDSKDEPFTVKIRLGEDDRFQRIGIQVGCRTAT